MGESGESLCPWHHVALVQHPARFAWVCPEKNCPYERHHFQRPDPTNGETPAA